MSKSTSAVEIQEPDSTEPKAKPFASGAYAEAERTLRERHADEFESILQGIYDAAGVKRVKRLSAEERAKVVAEAKAAKEAEKAAIAREKALAAAQALAAQYPDLVSVTAPVEPTEAVA